MGSYTPVGIINSYIIHSDELCRPNGVMEVLRPDELCQPNLVITRTVRPRSVGTRGGCGAGWGPCACPRHNTIRPGFVRRSGHTPGRTSTRPPHPLHPAPCPYRRRPTSPHYPIRLEKFIRTRTHVITCFDSMPGPSGEQGCPGLGQGTACTEVFRCSHAPGCPNVVCRECNDTVQIILGWSRPDGSSTGHDK